MFESTAIYPNRVEDKEALESVMDLPEEGNLNTEFYTRDGKLFAKGYTRVVYGDHGPYIEFDPSNLCIKLTSKFNNNIDLDNLPSSDDFKYYYYWLVPEDYPFIKVYLQIKTVQDLPNAPKRADGKKSAFNRKEGYADYKRGMYYVDPYEMKVERK